MRCVLAQRSHRDTLHVQKAYCFKLDMKLSSICRLVQFGAFLFRPALLSRVEGSGEQWPRIRKFYSAWC